jgi:PAS domain S-box-containing protein
MDFKVLAEQSPSMIFINKGGALVYVNKKCEEIMGYKREEFYLPDFDFLTLIAPESVDMVKTNYARHMKGEEVEPYEYTLITKDGKRIDAIHTTELIDFDGERAILGIVTDITGRKGAEVALKESEERYRKLVELSPDGIVVHQDGKIVFVNTAGAELVGAEDFGELLGRPVLDLLHPEYHEIATERIRQMREEGIEVPAVEEKLIRLDGELVDVEVSGIPTTYNNRRAVQLVVRDITERKKAEGELKRKNQELERFNKLAQGRELKMIELKKEINALLEDLGRERKYRW